MTEEILFTGKEKRSSCSKEYHKMYTEKWRENNYPKGYGILCQNCNSSLGYYGYCPHKNI